MDIRKTRIPSPSHSIEDEPEIRVDLVEFINRNAELILSLISDDNTIAVQARSEWVLAIRCCPSLQKIELNAWDDLEKVTEFIGSVLPYMELMLSKFLTEDTSIAVRYWQHW